MAPLEVATTTSNRVEAAGRMPPSMEWEPKTLTLDQIKFARAALYVVSTKTEEEAIRIFTEGLKPVEVTVRKSSSFDSSSDDHVDLGCSSGSTKQQASRAGGSKGGAHRGCRRRRCSIDIERDVFTAPF